MNNKHVYSFGNDLTEGRANMKNLLGGKGANLAEMSRIGIPVPPGFTITTETCIAYNQIGKEKLIETLNKSVKTAIERVEKNTLRTFGSSTRPLLVSVRSGARVSMPGMMDTILNLGLNDEVVEGLAKQTGNPRFAWDSYRRFIQMYGEVVMGMKPKTKEDLNPFEEILEQFKEQFNCEKDTDLSADELKEIVVAYKNAVLTSTQQAFPTNAWDQLWGAITAVFDSWNNERAIYYRKINNIPNDWGTAVNVQAMVFGNMGENSATGVAFTRDAATGENIFNGEYLINAQGEDVVAGTRTPQQITKEGSIRWAKLQNISEEVRKEKFPSLEEKMPETYLQLCEVEETLELHYKDMQDLEFTVQDGQLWLLQTRSGKRTGTAMVNIAMDLLREGIIDEKTALNRIEPNKLDELLHPVFHAKAIQQAKVVGKGLPASPGAATGQIVFFADEAQKFEDSILVRIETSPEDLEGMHLAKGILTSRGGMTSHAAVVARGMGKCCVSGAGDIKINYKTRKLLANGLEFSEGDWISINGTTGEIYEGKVETHLPEITQEFEVLMTLADQYSKMYVRTNADTPHDASIARKFGAKGIGLCRTEHMFFEGERIKAMREMILSSTKESRNQALAKLLPLQRNDFEGIFEAMDGFPVTIRLLDPPLHEFVPHDEKSQMELATEMDIPLSEIKVKISSLEEVNPMLGHRGCRLGNTYPEITEIQTRAILEAALNVKQKGIVAKPEIMVPLIGSAVELKQQIQIIRRIANELFEERNDKIEYLVGTMIEVPRAALTADLVAAEAEFFSFGTNDLTQMTYGYSRDDAGKFLPIYIEKELLKHDPFQVLDQEGVGQLVKMACEKGKSANPNLKIGICGEHGGEPSSVEFCHRMGMEYVSCSPYRVPIARIAAAQATLLNEKMPTTVVQSVV